MAYDDKLASRVRKRLAHRKDIVEKKMFGGLAFMLNGNMCCGVVKDTLMVRVPPGQYEMMLKEPHARPMDFTGRPLRGFVYVDPKGLRTDGALEKWLKRAIAFASSLPAK